MTCAWPEMVKLLARHHVPRPPEPPSGTVAWYRGWECGYEPDRAHWTGEGYVAYKGGCDLDVPQALGATWAALLDHVDDEEDE